ncbi:putative ATP-dependent DNA helicase [Tupanvirus deep ocean]|uniref:ATP-dependent DNA helicase n=2 Tax=Tupanvirus TaxID=2094720 RepID=A0AC62A7D2_9VIRU|nr:putative ATP-dependent DNA helicase [Tupanvirus deep ocean]QKU33634.1 putative ATP-dependent DNA helicase [Tupanvirus deep ocean]
MVNENLENKNTLKKNPKQSKTKIIKPKRKGVIKLLGGSKRSTKKPSYIIKDEDVAFFNPIKFCTFFWSNIKKFLPNPTIICYLKIFGIDVLKLENEVSDEFNIESKKMIKAFLKYPTVSHQLYKYIKTKNSKIDFLEKFSDEQFKYITSLDTSDTKLLACAGSGKTRSIIGRIKFMVEHGLAEKDDIYAITFSKHAATDFHRKIKELFPNYAEFCQLKNFSTIDSLAKSILCRIKSHKSENVEILSIAFRNYLKDMPDSDIEVISAIKNVKHLFIDEAQDLNEVQYDAAMLLKQKFGTQIHLIGDPNQNIFQFRRSSSTYLINFPSRIFELTKNFRSTQEIINFSECIKPIETTKSVSATGKTGHRVTIITKPAAYIHKLILQFINLYSKEKDISNIAIICPTRGIGVYDSVGLSVFFNFLKINNIPFNQLYDESGTNDERKRDVGRIPGHVNLITYHGTKGLEFDVVFVMDFYQFLFNIKPTEEEHKIVQYLLYVASSRAISLMFICTYTNMHSGYLNHWITKVPPEYYFSDSPLKIPHLSFRDKDKGSVINGITELIGEMPDEKLDMVHDALNIKEDEVLFTRRIYKDFTHIDRGKDETLFGIFCEELFYLQHHLIRDMPPRKFSLIQIIIDSKFVVVDNDSDYKILKTYIVTNKLTWERFDAMRNNMPERICRLIEKYFTRDKELNDFVVCTNEFVKIIEMNTDDIKKTYEKYLDPSEYSWDYKNILLDFFYLIVVQYAYDINHYYYICNHGAEKHDLLYNGYELYDEINKYVSNNYLKCNLDIKVNVCYPKLMLLGEIDFIEKYHDIGTENIVEIKCAKEISIRYYIQLLLYNFCYYNQRGETDKLFSNKFKIVNLLTGLEHRIILNISPTNMFNLLIILAEIGNLTFNNLNLVYDLETNNTIENIGPLDFKPVQRSSRSHIYNKNGKYFIKIYPEITEIAIKDYETGMVLLDTLVKPNNPILPAVQEITGITPSMLLNKPRIESIRLVLDKKMKNFLNCKLMAHNGNRFDNEIILFDKLVDPNKVSFLDTLSIIPIHLPQNIKLDSKSLGKIYYKLFGKNFNAHRAMSDVDALIKIMKHLKIEF